MNFAKITEQLEKIHAALVAKTGVQPWSAPSLDIGSGMGMITLRGDILAPNNGILGRAKGDTPEACISDAFRIIAELPDPETAALHSYMDKLGKVVDEGREAGIPDEYTEPVSLTIKAMSDNLLAAPKVSA